MPALCSLLLRGNISEKDNFFMRWAKAAYAPSSRASHGRHAGAVVGGVVGASGIGTVDAVHELEAGIRAHAQ
jgi:Cu/Ag efflux pump CusA